MFFSNPEIDKTAVQCENFPQFFILHAKSAKSIISYSFNLFLVSWFLVRKITQIKHVSIFFLIKFFVPYSTMTHFFSMWPMEKSLQLPFQVFKHSNLKKNVFILIPEHDFQKENKVYLQFLAIVNKFFV